MCLLTACALAALLVVPLFVPDPRGPSLLTDPMATQPQVAFETQPSQFLSRWNEFALAWNDLSVDLRQGLLPLKKFKRVKQLWDKLYNDRDWPKDLKKKRTK
ncbi:MAG TPA: hypothetical protein VMH03_07310 [Terriglobales bacterium]|nr:hypothetical protein [Terriglobales bacterium]